MEGRVACSVNRPGRASIGRVAWANVRVAVTEGHQVLDLLEADPDAALGIRQRRQAGHEKSECGKRGAKEAHCQKGVLVR